MRRSLSSRSRSLGWIPTSAGLAALLALGLTPIAHAGAATPAGPEVAGAAAQADSTHIVSLVTGDRVVVHDVGGREGVVVVPRAGATGGYVTETMAGDSYVIPAIALAYLGSSLDRSLFDVSALVRNGFVDKVPVQVDGTAPGVVDGYVTASSAPAFGAALAAQAAKDSQARFVERGPLFGTASAVRLAAPGAPQRLQPNFPMHTLRILGVGMDGAPTAAFNVDVLNVDDSLKCNESPTLDHGEARISVPSGHYSATAFFLGFGSTGVTEMRMVTVEFAVTGDQTVTIDERKATSQVSIATPKPSTLYGESFGYKRTAADGGWSEFDQIGLAVPLYVTPAPPVAVGARNVYVRTFANSPTGVKEPYSYDLKLDEGSAIQPDQHFTVTQDQLAAVRENYSSDTPNRPENMGRLSFLSFEPWDATVSVPFTAPLRRTEYVMGSPDMAYQESVAAQAIGQDLLGFADDDLRRYTPGSTSSHDWLRGPIAPGVFRPTGVHAGNFTTTYCGACRHDDTMYLGLDLMDSAGHRIADLFVHNDVHLQVLSGNTVLLDTGNHAGAVTVPNGPADYKVVYDETRPQTWFRQSAVSHTEWTFSSAHSGKTTVPANWFCDATVPNTVLPNCSALPMVTASYQLDAGTDGAAPAGPDQMVVTFEHVPGAPNPEITSGSVQVSFDAGLTWTPTIMSSLGGGRFRAQWTNPASRRGGDVAVRVSATDVAGSTIIQSVIGAFSVPGTQN